jgi:esterase/lipase superfamily enzyme
MQISYHKEYSHQLGRDMEYKIYGHKGKPALVFPTSNGRFYQYEDFGMIEALSGYINEGKIQIWTVDGIDEETFFSDSWDKLSRIKRHEQYFNYLNEELIPSILQKSKHNNDNYDQQLLLTGCSMGAFHAANFFFRYPWTIDSVIALSGVYSSNYFFGDYKPTEIYLNSPIDYLLNNHDNYYLDRFKECRLIFCCGHGAYEEDMLGETYQLKNVLQSKEIPAQFDFWGNDSKHDWDWWQKQIVYFLDKVL